MYIYVYIIYIYISLLFENMTNIGKILNFKCNMKGIK